MRCSCIRYLALACSLLLALPPNWCCYIAGAAARARQIEAADTPVCPCCKHVAPSAPTDDDSTPPPPCRGCPCDERQATSVEPAASHAPELSLPAVAVPTTFPPATVCGVFTVRIAHDLSPPPDPSPLNLLNCLWLC